MLYLVLEVLNMKNEWLLLLAIFALPNFVKPDFPTQNLFAQGSVIESLFTTIPFDHADPNHFEAPAVESNVVYTSGLSSLRLNGVNPLRYLA